MSGYTRQSASEIIATNVVKAAPVNAEYNKLRDAFAFDSAGTTGHKHDGSSDEGSYVPLIADIDGLNKVSVDTSNNRVGVFVEVSSVAVEQVRFQDGAFVPVTDNDIDLGAVGAEFKDIYIDGVAYIDDIQGPLTGDVTGNITSTGTSTFTTVDINGGAIDATTIGASTAAAITGTTITASTGFVGGLTGNVTGDLTGNVTGNITSSGSSTFSGTLTVPTPISSTDAATKAYVDSQLDITISDFGITESGTDLNFSYSGGTIATLDSTGSLDVTELSLNGTAVISTAAELNKLEGVTSNVQTQLDNISVTNATLTKSFTSGETSTIALSQAITAGAPVVSVTKEVPQTGLTNNDWDVGTTGANYTRHDTAYNTTLTPSSIPADIDQASYDSVSFSVASEELSPTSIAFNSDGSKMYVVGLSNDSVFQYSLSTAFDLSTASYDSVSFSVASEDLNPAGIAFNSDGTKMYMVGLSNDSVFQYSLSTAFDLSTASYDSVSFNVNSQEAQPYGIAFNNDGTKMYVVGVSGVSVYQYSLSTAFDLSTASYDSVSFSVAGQAPVPYDLAFNNHGTKMYILGAFNDTVYQYSLSTSFDLSTASYDSVSFSVTTEDGGPQGITFNNDGSKMYMLGSGIDTVFQYTLPAPTESLVLGTGSFVSADVGKTIEGNGGEAILTATDGSYSLVTAFTDSSTIAAGDWSMYATVFDATNGLELSGTAEGPSYDSVSFSVAAQSASPLGIAFNSDGTKMYAATYVASGDNVFQYSLSTAFDLNTASYDSVSFDVSAQELEPRAIVFNNDGTKMYISGADSDTVFQYSLSTAFDLSTASYDSVSFSVASQDSVPYDIAFNSDGTKMYMIGSLNKSVFQYTLSTAFDLSTASYDSVSFSVTSQESGPRGITFNSDGSKMYVVGSTNDSVFQYSLSTAFDLSTASYDSVSFSVASQDSVPYDIAFNSDGTKMYILGGGNDSVYQYSLPTGFDLTIIYYQPTAPSLFEYTPAITNASGQIDSTNWVDINSMTTTEVAGDGEVYYAVSTDNRTTWSVIDNTNGVRDIVRNNGGTWEVNISGTYGSESWMALHPSDELASLSRALYEIPANRMDKTQLEAVTDANHYTLGNSLDLMIALYLGSNSVSIPSSDGVSINYDANALDQGAVLGTDYDWDFPANDVVRITSNATQNLKVRVV